MQNKQEAFEKFWAHSPLRAAARRCFTLPFTSCCYCRTLPALSMSTTTTTTTTTMRDRGDRYGPIEWAQLQGTPAIKNSTPLLPEIYG